jgi:hypothetical protein
VVKGARWEHLFASFNDALESVLDPFRSEKKFTFKELKEKAPQVYNYVVSKLRAVFAAVPHLRRTWPTVEEFIEVSHLAIIKSVQGGKEQAPHCDVSLNGNPEYLEHLKEHAGGMHGVGVLMSLCDKPFKLKVFDETHYVALNEADGTCASARRQLLEAECREGHVVYLSANEIAVFSDQLVHAGAAYETEHLRCHVYIPALRNVDVGKDTVPLEVLECADMSTDNHKRTPRFTAKHARWESDSDA